MAVSYVKTHAIGRASGKGSAVGSAAYRACQRLEQLERGGRDLSTAELAAYRTGEAVADRSGKVHDYTRKEGVAHTEIVLPEGVDAAWALDRQTLWQQAEAVEDRCNSRLAREWQVGLPHELKHDERVELARDFARALVDRYGLAADVAVHAPSRTGDQRNWHAHVLVTTREITNEGFGAKTSYEWSNTNLKKAGLPYTSVQTREMRMVWQDLANEHLARAGHDVRIDCRSYKARGIELEPRSSLTVGRHYAGIRDELLGGAACIFPVETLDAERSAWNAGLIEANPEALLDRVVEGQSTFTRQDVAKVLHRFVNEDWERFEHALNAVMQSRSLVCLVEGGRTADTGVEVEAVWSTRDVALREATMLERAERLAVPGGTKRGMAVALPAPSLLRAIAAVEQGEDPFAEWASKASAEPLFHLSDEQRRAVEVLSGNERLAMLRGVAGTGKTTALSAVRIAAVLEDRRIVGAALAGKAARELEAGSGIESRTLASWERSWEAGYDRLGPGDILVVDEAGMVGSAQMGRVLEAVEDAGAKIVLVGDERQLQPIEAGAAFRTIKDRLEEHDAPGKRLEGERERAPVAELSEVRRQGSAWQREASELFGAGRTSEALDRYRAEGHVRLHATTDDTRVAIVQDYFVRLDEARAASPDGRRGCDHIVTAYRNEDVAVLNDAIRSERVARGELSDGVAYRTEDGERTFAVGDRVLLTRNDRELGVANGDRGEVIGAVADRLDVRLTDGRYVRLEAPGREPSEGTGSERSGRSSHEPRTRERSERQEGYGGVRHGYAVTTHRAQGMTVDRVHVMASTGMHAQLAYVAMTRQRDEATLHASREHFRNYETLRDAIGRERTSYGVGDYLVSGISPGQSDGHGNGRGGALDALAERTADTARVQQRDADERGERANARQTAALTQGWEGEPTNDRRSAWSSLRLGSPEHASSFASLNLSRSDAPEPDRGIEPASSYTLAERIDIERFALAMGERDVARREGTELPHHEAAVAATFHAMREGLGSERAKGVREALARNPKLVEGFGAEARSRGREGPDRLDELNRSLDQATKRAETIRRDPVLRDEQQREDERQAKAERQQQERAQSQSNEISMGM